MLDAGNPGTPNQENEMPHARPSRTHVFDTAPNLEQLLAVWREYGEPSRVEISHALHKAFLVSPESGNYRGWRDSLDCANAATPDDGMLGANALWLRSFEMLPSAETIVEGDVEMTIVATPLTDAIAARESEFAITFDYDLTYTIDFGNGDQLVGIPGRIAERIARNEMIAGESFDVTPFELPRLGELGTFEPVTRVIHTDLDTPPLREPIRLDPTKTYAIEGKDFDLRGVPADEAARIVAGETRIGNLVNVLEEAAPVDRKSSDGKLAMNLVTSDLVRQAAAADTYGAEKYEEPGSWRNAPVEDVVRYVDAAERHLSDVKAFLVEGKKDRWLAEDSKLAHLAHLAATVGILIEFAQRMNLDLPEEFDRHWLRDPNDPRCERDLLGFSEPDSTVAPPLP